MSILLNGGSNPTQIKYVSGGTTTNLSEVWYKSSPSATAVKVWPDKPATIDIYYSGGSAEYPASDYRTAIVSQVYYYAPKDSTETKMYDLFHVYGKYIYEDFSYDEGYVYAYWHRYNSSVYPVTNNWYLNGATNPTGAYYTFADGPSSDKMFINHTLKGSNYYYNTDYSSFDSLIANWTVNENKGHWIDVEIINSNVIGTVSKCTFIWPDTNYSTTAIYWLGRDYWGSGLNKFKIWVPDTQIAGVSAYNNVTFNSPLVNTIFVNGSQVYTSSSLIPNLFYSYYNGEGHKLVLNSGGNPITTGSIKSIKIDRSARQMHITI